MQIIQALSVSCPSSATAQCPSRSSRALPPSRSHALSHQDSSPRAALSDASRLPGTWTAVHELFGVIKRAAESDRQKNRYRKAFLVAIGLIVCLLCLMGAMIVAINIFMQQQFVESTEQATPLADKAGTVLASAKALVSVPLLVAPVLKAKQLGEIENLQVSYEDPHLDGVQTTVYYTISTVKHVNSTAIQFLTDRGDTLSVWNGETFVQLAGSDVKYPVCKADVSCSALKVADFTASGELVTEAHEALDRAGFTWRRQLAETQCLYQGANFVSLHQRECSSLIDPMDLSGSPPIGGTAEQKQNCNRAEHCNVDYAARPNVCYDKCETLDTQAECEEGKGQRPEASWWNGYLRDANEGTRGCQWLDQPSEVTGKRCDVDCTERETLWDCIKHDKCQWVGQKSPLKFFCDNKCPVSRRAKRHPRVSPAPALI